ADGRIRLLSGNENRGLATSLNRGLESCRAAIAVQLDSDDWLEPGALESIWDRMQSDQDIGAVYGRAILHEGKRKTEEKGYQAHKDKDFLEYSFVQAPRAYRVHVLRGIGGWSIQDVFDGRYFEDRLTLARVARVARVSFIDEALYNVEFSEDSL